MSAINEVRDLGNKSGEIFIRRLDSDFSNAKTLFRGIQGAQYQTNGFTGGHDRYGNPNLNIPGALLLQATNWSKKVTVTGTYPGGSVYQQVTKYLRVYRELSYSYYADKSTDLTYVPIEQDVVAGRFSLGGSIGYPSTLAGWNLAGYYAAFWILWKDSQSVTRGALIDWSYLGRYKNNLDKDTFYGTPKVNGLNFFHSGLSVWNSTFGLESSEKDDITYYVNDAQEAPIKTTETLSRPPTILREDIKLRGPGNVRVVTSRTSPVIGSDALGILPGAKNEAASLRWSNIEVNYGGRFVPVAVSDDDYQRINILLSRATPIPQPSQLGGATITTANFVKGTILFSSQMKNGSPSYWVGNGFDINGIKKFIYPIVVPGSLIQSKYAYSAGVGPYSVDSSWVSGHVDPTDYWYVLPRVKRTAASGCCSNDAKTYAVDADEAADLFVSALSCHQGRHFGKFLNSVFTQQSDLDNWLTYIEDQGRATAANSLFSTYFTGYRAGTSSDFTGRAVSARMSQPSYYPIQFSIDGLPEFKGYSQGLGITTIGGGSATPYSAKPKQTILKSLSAPFSSKAFNSWTVDGIIEFAKSQAQGLGEPLFDVKNALLQLYLGAKIEWLVRDSGMSENAATSAAQGDPVYKALANYTDVSTPATGGSRSRSGTSTRSTNKASTKADKAGNETRTIRIVRGLPGYTQGIRATALSNDKPELVQLSPYLIKQPDGTTTPNTDPLRFEFPFVPREVNYSGLGVQWTEIERTGNFPIVDWQNFQLLKISFNFDIVDRQLENQTGFGLYWSCEEQISTLRKMAQSPYPVTFLNMDRFMSEEVRYPLFTRGRGIEFVIAEFSVTAVQRTPANASNIADQIVPNQISRATASMTLQEIPLEVVDIVQMPPIKPCNKKKKKCEDIPDKTEIKDRTYNLFTPIVTK